MSIWSEYNLIIEAAAAAAAAASDWNIATKGGEELGRSAILILRQQQPHVFLSSSSSFRGELRLFDVDKCLSAGWIVRSIPETSGGKPPFSSSSFSSTAVASWPKSKLDFRMTFDWWLQLHKKGNKEEGENGVSTRDRIEIWGRQASRYCVAKVNSLWRKE